MVIDTSALSAILTGDKGKLTLEVAIDRDPDRYISAVSVMESSIVLESRFGDEGGRELDLLIAGLPIEVKVVDLDQLDWAMHAYRTYGKGRHPAGLNFGDCFSYALSKATGEPLLFQGGDFARTDLPDAQSSSPA